MPSCRKELVIFKIKVGQRLVTATYLFIVFITGRAIPA